MIFFLLLCAFVSITLTLVFIVYWKLIRPAKYIYDAFRRQGVSGEPFVPIIGQLPELNQARANDQYMTYYEKIAEKHGDVFLMGFGPWTRLFIHDPDLLADVLGRPHAHDYTKTPLSAIVFKPIIGIHNLLVSEGKEHERARKMLNPAFHFVNLQSMVSIMIDQTRQMIDELLITSTHRSVDLQTEFSALTLTIISSCAFGKGFESITNAKSIVSEVFTKVLEAIEYRTGRMINIIPVLAAMPFWRKRIVNKGAREIAQFVEQIIADRRQDRSKSLCSGSDILDLLLSAVDTHGQPFADEEIKDEALAFVLAGHETTGNLLVWAMYVLMTNEQVLCACLNEVDRVIPSGINPSYEHINNLTVCEAVLHETLRLYPPAPLFARYCIREHTIGSGSHRPLFIPVNTPIVINSHILHRRAEFWPRPLEFDYTRWMRDSVTGRKPKLAHPFCYLPFAAGPRNCIGQNFALLEAKVILAMLLKRCHFELEPGQIVTPDVRITMRPKYGLRARISKR
ncbi:unnamed protein product [Rotaria sp. Silwood2]|nr:unnamed protein product [Rotaria sp. Silwood2]CAF2741174.1 unnamed protein product [Rotaria sp. Silwood2]CAF3078299.1 unnamed protein product [Rotaria sp. Silwood2]CAF4267153.1 unnamed protein product [Rotaria sp. Silwood2]CAF4362118.1 unnamed protein product [Rotaria sp. Silwood2]